MKKQIRSLANIPDAATRETVARLTIQYWDEAIKAAAGIHPNWRVTPEGKPEWLGGRTGPRTRNGLFNWFAAICPDECAQIHARIRAKFLFDHTPPAGKH